MRGTQNVALWTTYTAAEAAQRFVTFVLLRRVMIAIFAFSLLWGHPAVAANSQVGVDAYRRGDYVTALREFRALAKQGEARAQSNLGSMYSYGHGVPQDYTQALFWYRLAAEQGYAHAQFNVGAMYNNGHGVLQDYTQALFWFRLAAEQGEAEAQFNVGAVYVNGHGVPQDYTQSYAWLNLAARQGHENAIKGRDIVLKLMTAAQVNEGQILSHILAQRIAKGSKLDLR